LYDLPGFRVVSLQETPLKVRRVTIMGESQEHACPRCGVLVGGKPYDLRESRVKDLPVGHRPVEVMWRKRRYRCPETRCAQRVFTERSEQIPPRHRLTGRLRVRLEQAASRCGRALSDVAAEYRVSWWSVHRSLVVAAAARTPATLPPVRRLGLDETRARSLRWAFDPDIAKWRLSDPWMTSFVDLDTDRPGWLLGLVPGRSGAAVTGWLSERDQAWRATRSRSSRWTRRRRSPPRSAGCCRRPPSWSTTSTWSVWPTRCSPRSANGWPASNSADAAAKPMRRGHTAGCCSRLVTGSRAAGWTG